MFWFMIIASSVYNLVVLLSILSIIVVVLKCKNIWTEKHPDITLPHMDMSDKILTVLRFVLIVGMPIVNLVPIYLAAVKFDEFCDGVIEKLEEKYL